MAALAGILTYASFISPRGWASLRTYGLLQPPAIVGVVFIDASDLGAESSWTNENPTSKIKGVALHVLIGVAGLVWLYTSVTYYQRNPAVSDFAGILNLLRAGLAALTVVIAVHYFARGNEMTRVWLYVVVVLGSGAFNALRAIREGQNDEAGRWILLGTLGVMVVIAILYQLLRRLSSRRSGEQLEGTPRETPP